MPKPITDQLTDLHDKHLGVLSDAMWLEMADDNTYYHKVMDAFLLDVQNLIQAARVDEVKRLEDWALEQAGKSENNNNQAMIAFLDTRREVYNRLATLNSEGVGITMPSIALVEARKAIHALIAQSKIALLEGLLEDDRTFEKQIELLLTKLKEQKNA